jgi:enamine deaminase RidA (YjgF/YER057c/UK114 family)
MAEHLTPLNPPTLAPPFSNYAHAVAAGPGLRWLHVSGQVGVGPDGTLAAGVEAQMERTWRNVLGLLAAADMTAKDLVKVTAYIVRGEDTAVYRRVRDRMLEGATPASTLVVVAALAHPDWLVEIEAVAAALA